MTFSFVIPVFNVVPYLRDCLESVLSQTDGDFEAICVDDGSTDGSGEILDEFSARDCRIRVFHQSNQGVSVARNVALRRVSGDWVLFVDADDVVAPRLLQKCRSALPLGGDHISFGSVDFCEKGIPRFCPCDEKARLLEWKKFTDGMYYKRNIWQGCCRAALFNDLQFNPKFAMGEDREFQARLFCRCRTFCVLEDELYAYRRREGSAMMSALTARKLNDRLQVSMLVAGYYARAGLKLPPSERRFDALYLTEYTAWDYFMLSDAERKQVVPSWIPALRLVASTRSAPSWCRLASRLGILIPCDFVWRLLFWTPMYLKRKGIHR